MKFAMLFLILCCSLSLNLGAAKKFEYDGNYPYIDSWFTPANGVKFKTKLEIEYVFSFYFGKECAKNCTTSPISPTYDSDIYNAEKTKTTARAYKYETYSGDEYQGYLATDLTRSDDNTTFDVITKAYAPAPLDTSGVLGLFVAEDMDFMMRKMFSEMTTKQIIFRRGPFVQYLLINVRVNPKGAFVTDSETLDGCGSFTYFPTLRNQGWKIKGAIKLADETFDNRTIEFSLDSLTTVPNKVYKKYFKNLKYVDDLPNLVLITSNGEFAINFTNFVQYKNKYRDVLSAHVQPQRFKTNENFVLGDNFLSDYCIALRATNAEISEFEIGLAPSTEIDRDPKWEKKIPPRRDDGNGGKDGGLASTAALNIVLIAALYLGIAV